MTLTLAGWCFLIAAWAAIGGGAGWCIASVLRSGGLHGDDET